ncbi:MAG: hypothetical protein VB099_10880 [Candidatus Limiplasma sp.]|nr:hypothetical protein [Candidatus Limiplasma sp.]
MIFLIACVFACISLVDLPVIVRLKKWRELIVFILLLAPALIFALLLSLGVKIPSTLDALGALFEQTFGKIYPQQ